MTTTSSPLNKVFVILLFLACLFITKMALLPSFFSLDEMPRDMVLEIYQHLDTTSRRAWRRADPRVCGWTVPPTPHWDWKILLWETNLRKQCEIELPRLAFLCQAVFDDAPQHLTEKLLGQRERQVLRLAAATGGALLAFQTLPIENGYLADVEKNRRKYIWAAAANGHWGFIETIFGLQKQHYLYQLYRALHLYDPHDALMPMFCKEHPMVLAARNGRFEDAKWYIDTSICDGRRLTTAPLPAILRECVHHGYVKVFEAYPNYVWSGKELIGIIENGTSTVALEWIEKHKPHLLQEVRVQWEVFKMVTLKHQSILEWLVVHHWLDLKKDLELIVTACIDNQHFATLAWVRKHIAAWNPGDIPQAVTDKIRDKLYIL
jgi:hypothetical protein